MNLPTTKHAFSKDHDDSDTRAGRSTSGVLTLQRKESKVVEGHAQVEPFSWGQPQESSSHRTESPIYLPGIYSVTLAGFSPRHIKQWTQDISARLMKKQRGRGITGASIRSQRTQPHCPQQEVSLGIPD